METRKLKRFETLRRLEDFEVPKPWKLETSKIYKVESSRLKFFFQNFTYDRKIGNVEVLKVTKLKMQELKIWNFPRRSAKSKENPKLLRTWKRNLKLRQTWNFESRKLINFESSSTKM